jgi:hypothetical protein
MPEAPHIPLTSTVRTEQRVSPRALRIPLPIGQPSDDLHGALDDAFHLGQRRLNHALHLGKRLGRLHSIIADTLEAFGHRMLNHAPDKRVHIDGFALHAVGAVRAVMVRDVFAVIAINAPDRDRRAHHVCGHVARHALGLRRDLPLVHVGHQTVGIFPATHIHQLFDSVGCERRASRAQPVPLPFATQEGVGQGLEMLPALARAIIPPTGGNHMQMGMILPIAPMGVYHGNVATPKRLAPDVTLEIIQALRPTAHERAQHDRRVLVQGRAAHRRDRQDDVSRDDALMQSLPHLTHPVVDGDFGAP